MAEFVVKANDPRLGYTGRIEITPEGATFCWCGSKIYFGFKGTKVSIKGKNLNFGPESFIGAVVDGKELCFKLGGSCDFDVVLAEDLKEGEHEVTVYKRMEGHYFTISEIVADGELLPPKEKPKKRIEVYGDSVSAGSVVDAIDYIAKPDPEDHNGRFDNALHAYPQLVAKMLPAEVYDTSQGGIAIFDGTGYFEMPNTRGVESCFDKLRYSSYHPTSDWDFGFVPHVVIMAIGQNDAYPDPDVLKNEDGYEKWVNKYIEIINAIRSHAPKSAVVLALTVLMHDPAWDDALEDIKNRLGGEGGRAYHFMYSRCGKATPGHPRYPEQIEMAEEMTAFLRTLPEEIWED